MFPLILLCYENRHHTPLERLKGFAFRYILHEPNDRFWRFWMNYTVYGSRNEELRTHQVHWFKKQQSFWTKLVREAVQEGELSSHLDPAETAEQLLIFTHGLMVWQILQPHKSSQAHCRKHSGSTLRASRRIPVRKAQGRERAGRDYAFIAKISS
jgi:BetI-type transcriptional repressor, C-terminal